LTIYIALLQDIYSEILYGLEYNFMTLNVIKNNYKQLTRLCTVSWEHRCNKRWP